MKSHEIYAENHRTLSKLVEREVICNLCQTMQMYQEHDVDGFLEDFCHYDYEQACRDSGWIPADESAHNNVVDGVQYRYIIDLDERGEFRATVYQINEKGEDLAAYSVNGFDLVSDGFVEDIRSCEEVADHYCRLFDKPIGDYYLDAEDDVVLSVEGIKDYEFYNERDHELSDADGWAELANDQGIDAEPIEIYEFWAVNDWFANKLREYDQIVVDCLDFQVWGRCTTGQSISLDAVIARIAWDMEICKGQKNEWSDS